MIDWDEVFEDVNWKMWIAIIVAGIIVAVVMVWVGLDYSRAQNLKLKLQADKDQFDNFHKTVNVPNEKDLQALEKERQDLQAKLDAMPYTLPVKFDIDQIKRMVTEVGNRYRVDVLKVSPARSGVDGYCLIRPVDIAFTSASRGALADFLSDIQRLPVPHQMEPKPIQPGGVMEITVEFYYFDQENWEKNNSCDEKVAIPNVEPRDAELDGIVLFQGVVTNLKSQVDQELAGIVDTKDKFQKYCALQQDVDRLKTEYQILTEKTRR